MGDLTRFDGQLVSQAKVLEALYLEVGKAFILAKRVLRGVPEEEGQAERVELWARVLHSAGIGPEEVGEGFITHMQNSVFFPAPCEIIESVKIHRRRRSEAIRREQERLKEEARRENIRQEAEEEARIRAEWESLPKEERDRILADRRKFRRKIWDDLAESMAEFDRKHPDRHVPGFMSMADGVADFQGGDS